MASWVREQETSKSGALIEQMNMQKSGMMEKWKVEADSEGDSGVGKLARIGRRLLLI